MTYIIKQVTLDSIATTETDAIWVSLFCRWWTHDSRDCRITQHGPTCPNGHPVQKIAKPELVLLRAMQDPQQFGCFGLLAWLAAHHQNCRLNRYETETHTCESDWDGISEALHNQNGLPDYPGVDALVDRMCCICMQTKPYVRTGVECLFAGPVPGLGWGCDICRLPNNGAIALLCDHCLESGKAPLAVCGSYPWAADRVLMQEMKLVPFRHDPAIHPTQYAENAEDN